MVGKLGDDFEDVLEVVILITISEQHGENIIAIAYVHVPVVCDQDFELLLLDALLEHPHE